MCENVQLQNIRAKSDYFGKDNVDLAIDRLNLNGNYAFDGTHIKNSILFSKDAFGIAKISSAKPHDNRRIS